MSHQVDGAADRGGLGRGEVRVEGCGETLIGFRKAAVGEPDRLPRRLRDGSDDGLGCRLDPGVVRRTAGQLVKTRVDRVGPFGGPGIGIQRPGEHVEPAGAAGRGRGLQQGHQVAVLGRHRRLRPRLFRSDAGHAVEQLGQLGGDGRLFGGLAARLGLPQQLRGLFVEVIPGPPGTTEPLKGPAAAASGHQPKITKD